MSVPLIALGVTDLTEAADTVLRYALMALTAPVALGRRVCTLGLLCPTRCPWLYTKPLYSGFLSS